MKLLSSIRCWIHFVTIAASLLLSSRGVFAEVVVDYQRDIQPLLAIKCFRCHGPDKEESGLRLDVRSRAFVGGDGGVAIVPGKSSESELIRRVISADTEDRMPPEGGRLTAAEIDQLRRWIDQGAAGIPQSRLDVAANHWAFQPIRRLATPAVSNVAWPRNAIDRFVLGKLEANGIKPSPEAPRETLMRRLYFDLIGLPPPWESVQQFIDDPRPDAYERLVDALLASPHYGERWGRHWLDLARYADSTGYESDKPREVWAYRDWVINGLNADMPFDQFVTDQLAGDLVPNATIDKRIATGFHCNAMLDPGVRHESIIDRVNATGAVFLGLTTGCAQCHTHKTDPLTHREFYRLYAFFNDATITEMRLDGEPFQSNDQAVRDESATNDAAAKAEAKPATTLVMQHTPQPTHIFLRGDRANPGEQVATGLPAFLQARWVHKSSTGAGESRTHATEEQKLTRLDLACWLLTSDNPLTARVTANRIWQRLFGVGLVETESDFGVQTPAPIQLELLDYLASELRGGTDSGWQGMKSLQRLIVTSATYRQSSNARSSLAEVDPGNRLLARQRRIRLEAELIRDASLVASGLLCNKVGGPSVFPHQPAGILENRATPATWTMSAGEDRYRRGLYTWVWRLTPHPNLPLFDAPDGVTACTHRDRSNIPVQALTLLNDPTFVEAARALAAQLMTSSATSDAERILLLTRTCLSRDPTAAELELLQTLIASQRQALAVKQNDAGAVSGDAIPPGCGVAEFATWVVASRVVMNLDEFITRE